MLKYLIFLSAAEVEIQSGRLLYTMCSFIIVCVCAHAHGGYM